ncbi:hypothetical protein C8F01DRAFT_1261772 [Mycena amicta]|nr:hypothetical protein C8F01DRAFT_1261772 [Mycena amicta]
MTVVLNRGSRPCYSLRIMLSQCHEFLCPDCLCIDSNDWKVFPAFFVYCDSPREGNGTMSSKTPPGGAASPRSRCVPCHRQMNICMWTDSSVGIHCRFQYPCYQENCFSDDTSFIRPGRFIPPKLPYHVDLDSSNSNHGRRLDLLMRTSVLHLPRTSDTT